MKYKGFEYTPWEDIEDDNIKIMHDVITPTGKTISLRWSPYSTPSQQQFEFLIEQLTPEDFARR